MRNLVGFIVILCLSLALCSSNKSNNKAMPPTKPNMEEEILIQLAEASHDKVEFQCTTKPSTHGGDHNETTMESNGSGGWEDGFFTQIDSAFTAQERAIINSALYDLHQILCVGVFIWPQDVSDPPGDFVFIKKGHSDSGCYSYVGKQGRKQEINLGGGCVYKDAVIHECIHALGFHHEQSRRDRDDFVDIFWGNIEPGTEGNFRKYENPTYDVPYDYESVMHYSSFAFSKNQQPTILKKNGGIINPKDSMTSLDRLKLQRMYNCI